MGLLAAVPQYDKSVLNEIAITFNENFTMLNSMHQGFRMLLFKEF